LRNAIAWSYDLLDAGEQMLFRRLGVFVGGSTLEAVAAVCNVDDGLPLDVLDGIAALVNHSLLHQIEGLAPEGYLESRFTMLETIREYALDRLAAAGESETSHQLHAGHYLALAEAAEPELQRAQQGLWLQRLENEHDNLRAALQWAFESGRVELAAQLAGALWRFWYTYGHLSEGRRWLEQALAYGMALPPSVRAKALLGAGLFADEQGDYLRATALHTESLALWRELGDRAGVARALNSLGLVAMKQGDYERATALFEESLALRRALGDRWSIAATLNNLGGVAGEQGDYLRARVLLEESLALRRALGDQSGIASALNNLANAVADLGNHAQARTLLDESIKILRALKDRRVLANALSSLGRVTRDQDSAEAAASFRESLQLFHELGDRSGIAECVEGLAGVAVTQRPDQAARLFGAAAALREAIGAPLPPAERPRYEETLALARARMGEAAFATLWAEGQAMPLDPAIAYALGA
jgi:tetratricopeptide (TPR) repeat protein